MIKQWISVRWHLVREAAAAGTLSLVQVHLTGTYRSHLKCFQRSDHFNSKNLANNHNNFYSKRNSARESGNIPDCGKKSRVMDSSLPVPRYRSTGAIQCSFPPPSHSCQLSGSLVVRLELFAELFSMTSIFKTSKIQHFRTQK